MKKAFEIILSLLHKRLEFHENRMAELGGTERDVEDWGSVKAYSDAIDIVEKVSEEYKGCWIPISKKLPDNNEYILLSFENFPVPLGGRYKESDDGGSFYIGDDSEETCLLQNLFVNAWMPLPDPYKESNEE